MRNKTLRMVSAIIVIASMLVVTILILGNRSFKTTERAAFGEFNQRQLVLAREAVSGIELYFENLAGDMKTLSRMLEIQHFDQVPARREIAYMLDELEQWGVNNMGYWVRMVS